MMRRLGATPAAWSTAMRQTAALALLDQAIDALAEGWVPAAGTIDRAGFDGSVFVAGPADPVRPGDGRWTWPDLTAWQDRLVLPTLAAPGVVAPDGVADRLEDGAADHPSSDGLARSLTSLRSTLAGLSRPSTPSTWSGYSSRQHYVGAGLERKRGFVDAALGSVPGTVCDVGCNDGLFAQQAADRGARVVAFDADHEVVDALYDRLRSPGDRRILPLVADLETFAALHAPGPPFDLALCLAVAHHVLISQGMPLGRFVDLLAALAREVVVEIPTPDDEFASRLLRYAPNPEYSVPALRQGLERRFTISGEEVLPSGTRWLVWATRREDGGEPALDRFGRGCAG